MPTFGSSISHTERPIVLVSRPAAFGAQYRYAAFAACENEQARHDCHMIHSRMILLLAGSLTAGTANARIDDQLLTPSARQLIDAAGISRETFLRAAELCKRDEARIAGVDGTIAVDAGSFSCRGGSPHTGKSRKKTVLWASFQSNVPVTNCIFLEQADGYLVRQGWKHVSLPVNEHSDLMPITADYIDSAGATLTLSPYLRNTCLSAVTLRIDLDPSAR